MNNSGFTRYTAYDAVIHLSIAGLRQLQKGMIAKAQAIQGAPMENAMRDIVLGLRTRVASAAPRDLGMLKASIMPEVVTTIDTVTGIVGSRLIHALAQEQGTGTFVGQPRHFPPPSKLVGWVQRHNVGFPRVGVRSFDAYLRMAFIVARAIYRRGGLRPQWYWKRALNEYWPEIQRKIHRAIVGIIESQ